MKYTTVVKSALALAMGLMVSASFANDVPLYGATFAGTAVEKENDDWDYANGEKVSTYKNIGNGYGWFSGDAENDESIVTNQYLLLNTDASTLTNKFKASVASDLNDAIAADGAFFETEVKFVASDTQDAGIEGGTDATKFAIYAYCDEEASPVTTNLVVFHRMFNSSGPAGYTNEVFKDVDIDTTVYTKLRIEMKKLADPEDEGAIYNAFSVTVGNRTLSSDTALDAVFENKPTGTWFMTTENQAGSLNKQVSSLNFKGTGEIDNIKVGQIVNYVPDTNWTIEGFNPRGEWTDPTAVAEDSKTLFYSNLVVNIDDVDQQEGRTIKAAWLGAKIKAPEAVTAANIANWKFDMAGASNLSFDQSKDGQDEGGYFMYAWVPLTATKVRTAIANHDDIVYPFDFYEVGGTATQTLSLVICPQNITITNINNVAEVEEIKVVDWVEQIAQQGYNYPEGAAISDAAQLAWIAAKGFTQAQITALGSNAKFNECYLLNCDITQQGAGGTLTVTAIAVGQDVQVTVALARVGGYEGGINGVLKLYGTADLATAFAELDNTTIGDADFSEANTTTATFTGNTAKFFKAVVVAPAAE